MLKVDSDGTLVGFIMQYSSTYVVKMGNISVFFRQNSSNSVELQFFTKSLYLVNSCGNDSDVLVFLKTSKMIISIFEIFFGPQNYLSWVILTRYKYFLALNSFQTFYE
jgi:hypothetical protein